MKGKVIHKLFIYLLLAITFTIFGQSVSADGFIVIPDPPAIEFPTPFPLEVKYHHVNVEINEQTATTFIDQEFYNSSNRRLEGHYLFPVPKGAIIKRFSMYIDGKEVEAELLDAKKAKEIYEEIVRNMLDPALLEYIELALFKVRIFPIEPRSKKRIKISYNEILNKDNGTIEYLYPLNTEKFSSKPLQDVSINVKVKSKDNIKNIYCTTHEVDIVRKNNQSAIISYEAQNVKPDRNFTLYYNTDNSKVGLSLLTYKEEGEDGYFFISASPGFDKNKTEINEKDITFVLDVSGSMDGKKIEQAKKALTFCINNLNEGDRFEIIRFSTEAEALFEKLISVNKSNIKKAKEFVKNLKAIGGTNIDEALRLALSNEDNQSRPHIIIFITDGKPTIAETDEDRLIKSIKKANTYNTRIFTFGIGYDLNIHLLDKITEVTKAFRTYISPEEDMEVKISNFYNKVQSPVLININIKFSKNIKVYNIYPKDFPDLFIGSSLTILGRYKEKGGKTNIILEGNVKNNKKSFSYNADFPKENLKNAFIPSLWAARRIGYLLDQIRLHGENKELIDEITDLARKYGIITPYTSYLIIEDENNRVARNELDSNDQTLGNIRQKSSDIMQRSKKDYYSMKEKSGKTSIQASKELQELNKVHNFEQIHQGKDRLNFTDDEGNIQNLIQQVKNIQGRAIYNSGNYWVDSKIQTEKIDKTIRIKFAGKEYFDLLRNTPEAAQFLYLGKNVRFVLNNKIYEIYE